MEVFPEDWSSALAVVAHPDDMEYGAASAVARWARQGKEVHYLLVTRGEAGIQDLAPDEVVPLRAAEQAASCEAAGAASLTYLDHPDGCVVEGLELRRDIATHIRRLRPDALVSINHRDSWGGPSWNHADHRAVGRSLLDAARDAANRWIFPDAGAAWSGVRWVAFNASTAPSHYVDVTDTLEDGIASLRCHETYLAHLDTPQDPRRMLTDHAASAGAEVGVPYATTFEVVAV